MITVEASDARALLPSLLRRVEVGDEVIITRHGEVIARLVPVAVAAHGRADVSAAIAELKRLRAHRTLGGCSWQELRDEGRR